DAREESYYNYLAAFLTEFSESNRNKKIDITILPAKTEAGNPDFRIWDGKQKIIGYIEAKDLAVDLDRVEETEQLQRYLTTFPNVILTNYTEFRLYRDGELIDKTAIARPFIIKKLATIPPIENEEKFFDLLERFLDFSLPHTFTARTLAVELAKRTRFLKDEIVSNELKIGNESIQGFYEAFKEFLIAGINEVEFADIYSQTITYGLFAARLRAGDDFTRKAAFSFIPKSIGILRDIFRFISMEDLPVQMEIIIDDIVAVLAVSDAKKILDQYYHDGKGSDPVLHFYETFLSVYEPKTREKRGVYYTPEPVVSFIVRSLHQILKDKFNLADGLADKNVTLLDPAGGTLGFLAKAVEIAVAEFKDKYGQGAVKDFIKDHILQNFYAFELMMAPYAIGHMKISFLLEELGYRMADDERIKYYLTNTLDMKELEQSKFPGMSSLSHESHEAGKVKKQAPILVVLGNPPYSGISANINEWTERLLKEDIDGCQSYYKVDGKPLGEKKVWLQNDYVKFLRFAQWKIQSADYGIVGMITDHSYLDNPTFRGMRQSLMTTFDEIYLLDLHGNSLKKETTPDGGKDENVFDIRQGVAIAIFIKNKKAKKTKVFHRDNYGLQDEKYQWLDHHKFNRKNYHEIKPESPWYFFIPRNTSQIQGYLKWAKINEIFPVNNVGIVTARDNFAIDFDETILKNRIRQFRDLKINHALIKEAFQLKDTSTFKLEKFRTGLASDPNWQDYFALITYRPFDTRHIYYSKWIVERPIYDTMRHMLKGSMALILPKRVETKIPWQHCLCGEGIIDHVTVSLKTIDYVFPLFLSPQENKDNDQPNATVMMVFEPRISYGRKPNIAPIIFEKLETAFGKRPTTEAIFYYIYAVLFSNTYRTKYAEFLKIDFPRIPFTNDYNLFITLGKLGNQLADLHLLKSKDLDKTIAKFPESGDNKVAKLNYSATKVWINDKQYFDGVAEPVWHYHIGGYQVCDKWLKDRKGRTLTLEEIKTYCKIVTALAKTIELQTEIDSYYNRVEAKLI
ncbi:N-6 DNA methylase, partial [candidate division KSB1 bacterium]|nr:N-6 DNA methylase [candidate division KSB1 bacterium]